MMKLLNDYILKFVSYEKYLCAFWHPNQRNGYKPDCFGDILKLATVWYPICKSAHQSGLCDDLNRSGEQFYWGVNNHGFALNGDRDT